MKKDKQPLPQQITLGIGYILNSILNALLIQAHFISRSVPWKQALLCHDSSHENGV